MKVLFTGASSFTGFWFVGRLAAAGAEVVAPLRSDPASYSGVRAERAAWLGQWAKVVPDCAFGSPRFVDLIKSQRFDVLCHHAAEARDYRSPDFDAAGAAAANTLNLRETLTAFREAGGKAVVATGSVFEADEGAGPSPRRAFSPYGLSKGLTWRILDYWTETLGLALSKFVIANPFGPFEEPRFVAHAVATWAKGETLEVRTPRYLRDNIHVDLLSMAYARFVTEAAAGGPGRRFGPCGYMETQGAFAERLSRELGQRLSFEGRVVQAKQTDFSEPLARVNSDTIRPEDYGWDEGRAWDALGGYYRQRGFATPSAPAAAEIMGAVDTLDHTGVTGWLAARPGNGPRYLRVVVGDIERGVIRADLWRQDLRDKSISDGFSGYRFPFAGGLDPYADVAVRLEDRETGRLIGGGPRRAARLVGGEGAPFTGDGDLATVNVAWANYDGGRLHLMLEKIGAATRFGEPLSRNAEFEIGETTPIEHRYLAAVGTPVVRSRYIVRPRDPEAPIDIGFAEADGLDDGERAMCVNLIPARLPDYAVGFDPEPMARVSGVGETQSRFAATGLATAFRLDMMTRRHFGRALADCGPCLDWGAGAGRVALPLKRTLAPGLDLTGADVDEVNVAFGAKHFPDIAFVASPFLPPLPFADGAFGAIYSVSVFTHLTEGAQFAWLKELSRVARPGAPVIVTAHSEFQTFRSAEAQPEVLTEVLRRGISDAIVDGNLGPKLSEPGAYRATFHTRDYIRRHWSKTFDILQVYPGANGVAQDFVVMRAR